MFDTQFRHNIAEYASFIRQYPANHILNLDTLFGKQKIDMFGTKFWHNIAKYVTFIRWYYADLTCFNNDLHKIVEFVV